MCKGYETSLHKQNQNIIIALTVSYNDASCLFGQGIRFYFIFCLTMIEGKQFYVSLFFKGGIKYMQFL